MNFDFCWFVLTSKESTPHRRQSKNLLVVKSNFYWNWRYCSTCEAFLVVLYTICAGFIFGLQSDTKNVQVLFSRTHLAPLIPPYSRVVLYIWGTGSVGIILYFSLFIFLGTNTKDPTFAAMPIIRGLKRTPHKILSTIIGTLNIYGRKSVMTWPIVLRIIRLSCSSWYWQGRSFSLYDSWLVAVTGY
jgi:hypothetical protein